MNKILRVGFYWPTIFADVFKAVSTCHQCHIFEERRKLLPLPLRLIVVKAPFQQWGLDFIGEIKLTSSGKHWWILTTTEYFTKWIESIPCKLYFHTVVIIFLEEIMSRFGVPRKILTNNAKTFKAHQLVKIFQDNGIALSYSTTYYLQGNGLAKSSNKSIVKIIKRLLQEIKKAWDSKLKYVMWEDIIYTKRSIGTSPY